ncbi:hypothetical protein ALP47_200224 [Pseudomonas savastanoi]|nr:hypothetical protein ALP47_200224 [Pseudomonas savastanoi]
MRSWPGWSWGDAIFLGFPPLRCLLVAGDPAGLKRSAVICGVHIPRDFHPVDQKAQVTGFRASDEQGVSTACCHLVDTVILTRTQRCAGACSALDALSVLSMPVRSINPS